MRFNMEIPHFILILVALGNEAKATIPQPTLEHSQPNPRRKSGQLKWTYSGKRAPLFWRYFYKACGGDIQSPVNIIPQTVTTDITLGDLAFHGYDEVNTSSKAWTLKNNGNSVTLKLPRTVSIDGGGLPAKYVAAQLHFHWGSKESQGSEHEINGKRFPMELHIVHYNSNYSSLSEAMSRKQGLAVLGILFKIGVYDNPKITHLIRNFPQISYKDQSTELKPFPLRRLLPNLPVFYRYEGSLTTPPCSESVVWSVFKKPVYLSFRQMMMFRNFLLFSESKSAHSLEMVNNFRPIKPLNGRIIYQNRNLHIPDKEDIPETLPNENQKNNLSANVYATDPKWACLAIPVVIIVVIVVYLNHKRILSKAATKTLPDIKHRMSCPDTSDDNQKNKEGAVYIETPVRLQGYTTTANLCEPETTHI